CYGMRITDGKHTIVYTADTSFQSEWIPFSEGADLLIADCNFYDGQDGKQAGHMNSSEAARIANDANVQTLLLSHLPQYGDNGNLVHEARHVFSGNIELASEGIVW